MSTHNENLAQNLGANSNLKPNLNPNSNSSPKALPKTWQIKPLGEVGEIVSGGTPSTSNPEFWNGDIAWITPADLSNYTEKFISKGKRNISEQGLKNSSARLMPKGTILFSSRAPIGYVAISSNPVCTNQGFKNLIPNENLVCSEFVYYYLISAKNLAESCASGTTFKEISATAFSKLPIPLPPTMEIQRQIVQRLDAAFEKIDKAVARLKSAKSNLTRYKQSLLKAAFNGTLTKSPHATWQSKTLGEIFNVVGGGTPTTSKPEFWNGDIAWISSADIDTEKFTITPKKFITKEAIKSSATNLVEKDTIIVVTRVGLGKVGITDRQTCFSQDSQALIPLEKIDTKFMAFQIHKEAKNFISLSRGTTISGITKNTLREVKLVVPPLQTQKEIVQILERHFEGADRTEKFIDSALKRAKMLKQSLLKAAFEGALVQ